MFKINPIILGIIIFTLIILGGIILATTLSAKTPQAEKYQITDAQKPILKISETGFNFGKIKASDIKSKEITLENIGQKPLNIRNIYTSCGCTYANVIINGKESPRFSMHDNPAWQADVGAGQKAILKIFYQPSLMPVKGEVERIVYLTTNDPAVPEVKITFKAEVE